MPPTSPQSAGFTLLELLASIAIVATLAALGTVAYREVTQRATFTSTSANMRQMGTAIQMYTADHDGALPGPVTVAVFNYGRSEPQAGDLPHLGAYIAPYLDAPPNSDSGPARNYPIKALQCPSLNPEARNDYLVANYVTLDFPASGAQLEHNRFGSWGGTTFTQASNVAVRPKRMAALSDRGRKSPIVSTADRENWVSVSNESLPERGVFNGKRLWLFVDGTVEFKDESGLWTR